MPAADARPRRRMRGGEPFAPECQLRVKPASWIAHLPCVPLHVIGVAVRCRRAGRVGHGLRREDDQHAVGVRITAHSFDGLRIARRIGVSEHIHRFTQALDLWRHPFWEEEARDDLGAYCDFVRGTPLRLGIECDFVPGAEDRTATLLDAHDFDYVVGSVHFVGEEAVDHPGWDVWEAKGDADEVWRRYFAALAEGARSGLFDILAHPDLVKVWGSARPAPERDLRHHYEPAVEAIAESGIAVEVSTAGLRKPVGELYPSRAFAEMCVEAGASFALSSDAHLPEQVGFGYPEAIDFLASLGSRPLPASGER